MAEMEKPDPHEPPRGPQDADAADSPTQVGPVEMFLGPAGSMGTGPQTGSSPAAGESGSTGSAKAISGSKVFASRPAADARQATVISKRPPIADPGLSSVGHPSELGTSLEGRRLGHFDLEEFVGGGGMGAVYRALDMMLGRTVAVKVLPRTQTDDETVRRFKNEAQSAARLDHENIARVYYVGEDAGWNYIVFEFIEGVNIRDLVESQGPLSLEDAISFTLQISEALAHAHQRDVVHRDIKPSNVLITPQRRAKLVDMGLARLHQVEAAQNDLTASGVTLGTFDYISPEQARDPRSADVRSDLYSLGCTFYYMLTGRPPFPEGTVLQKLLSHSTDDPPDVRQYRPELPEDLSAILARLLAKQPIRRHQTPGELIAELLLLAERLDLSIHGRGATVWVTSDSSRLSPIERHLPWAVPVAAFLACVFGLYYVTPAPEASGMKRPPIRVPVHVPERDRAGGEMASADNTDAAAAPAGGGTASGAAPMSTGAPGLIERPVAVPDPRGETPARVGGSAAPAAPLPASPPAVAEGTSAGPADGGAARPPAVSGASPSPPGGTNAGGPGGAVPADSSRGESPSPGTGADPPAGGSPAAAAVARTPSERRVLVVGEAAGEFETAYPTIAAAVAALRAEGPATAEREVVIELRYNGRRDEVPFAVARTRLSIRGGEGYQPIVRFAPSANDTVTPLSMITVAGGEVRLEDVHIWLDLPDDPEDGWALFTFDEAQSLRMDNCTLTIRNSRDAREAFHPDVAFFDLKPRSAGGMMQVGGPAAPMALGIDLWHCVVRGEATLLRAREAVPLRFHWSNGLLITTERLLESGGARTEPDGDGLILLDLEHVTAIMDEGLCLLTTTESAPYELTLAIQSRDSLFLTAAQRPLIHQRGVIPVADFGKHVFLRGQGNFYPGTEVYCRAESIRDRESVEWDYARWKQEWPPGETPQRGVIWVGLPKDGRAVSLHTKADYALTDQAINLASDGKRVGFQDELLPSPPVLTPAAAPMAAPSAGSPSASAPMPAVAPVPAARTPTPPAAPPATPPGMVPPPVMVPPSASSVLPPAAGAAPGLSPDATSVPGEGEGEGEEPPPAAD